MKSIQSGIGLLQQGRLAEAGEVFAAAAQAEPSNALAHHLLGIVQLQTGAPEAGLASLRRSIALEPNDPVAHSNLANAQRDSGAADEALASYGRALSLNPDFVDALANRGMLLGRLGRLDEALQDCERSTRLAPGHPMTYVGRGNVLLAMNRQAEAVESFTTALRLAPGSPEIWSAHGEALTGAGRLEEAVSSFERALELGFDGPRLREHLGSALWGLGRAEDALVQYDRAIALDPALAQAWADRGTTLRRLDRHAEALESLTRAMALDSAAAVHPYNRAVVLADLGRNAEACADIEASLARQPDFRPAKLTGAHTYLASGQCERGWDLFEARWQGPDGSSWQGPDGSRWQGPEGYGLTGPPVWDGRASLAGKTILLRGEQGLGDTLQFCRYARQVKALGARVVLEAQTPLLRLLAAMDSVDAVVESSAEPPACDYQVLLMSLPKAFGTTLETIPGEVPYLSADPVDAARWQARIGRGSRPRVGLVWAGGFRDEPGLRWINARRNIALERLALLRGADVDFVSLQKGALGEGELKALKARGWDGPDILEVMDDVSDFADTAALVQALDLVIAVDTSTAHLAGALGKPVWLMDRYDTCWRWLTDREDSPWYPSLRLFRQESMSDWGAVVSRVRVELDRFAGSGP